MKIRDRLIIGAYAGGLLDSTDNCSLLPTFVILQEQIVDDPHYRREADRFAFI